MLIAGAILEEGVFGERIVLCVGFIIWGVGLGFGIAFVFEGVVVTWKIGSYFHLLTLKLIRGLRSRISIYKCIQFLYSIFL